jgi:hypothetical protein
MATSPIQATTVIQDLAKTITSRYDADGDGRLSSDEFSGFLSSFLGSLQNNPLTSSSSALSSTNASTATAAAADRPKVGTMAGFDAAKLANTSHTSPKYQIGRILQYYPNTPTGLKAPFPSCSSSFRGSRSQAARATSSILEATFRRRASRSA